MITNEVINRAINFILEHPSEDLTVGDIAAHVNFSRFHFSRMFKAEVGEGVFEFIKRIRLEQSAFKLKIETDKNITDVSGDYGISPSNFSTSFKRQYNLSPAEFRRGILQKSLTNPFVNKDVKLETFEECERKISIEMLEDRAVIYQRHKGSYANLAAHWDAFCEKYAEYITDETLFIERTYSDPSITDVYECIYDICITVPKNFPRENKPENTYIIKGGKYACYHFIGHTGKIYAAYQNIFNVWLPQSKYEIDDRYSYDIYRKIDCDSFVMEIDFCVPVK